jgi:hypothetical protein
MSALSARGSSPQGNTIPATFWTIAFILSKPEYTRRIVAEVDAVFADQPDARGHFDCEKLDFTEMCLKEALRLRGTGESTALIAAKCL